MRSLRPTRRTVVRLLLRTAAAAGAVLLTVALSEQQSRSAFTAGTADGGNQVTAAADFCTAPSQTRIATEDTVATEADQATPYGSWPDIAATSENVSNARSLVRFSLPARPTGCTLTGATLRLYANTVASGRVIQAWRADPATPWTEAATTWLTLPSGVGGTAVPQPSRATAGWMEWPVTAIVTSHYAGTNTGFLIRDSADGVTPPKRQLFDSRDKTNKPELVLTWG